MKRTTQSTTTSHLLPALLMAAALTAAACTASAGRQDTQLPRSAPVSAATVEPAPPDEPAPADESTPAVEPVADVEPAAADEAAGVDEPAAPERPALAAVPAEAHPAGSAEATEEPAPAAPVEALEPQVPGPAAAPAPRVEAPEDAVAAAPAEAPAPATVVAAPPERAAPRSLSAAEANRLVLERMPSGFYPVHRDGNIISVVNDLDGNGYPDLFVPGVRVGSFDEAEIGKIGRFSRLFEADTEVEVVLAVFMQRAGTLTLQARVPLGRKAVFDSLRIQPIVVGQDVPFAVSAGFQTGGGSVCEWVIFTGEGISRFSLHQRLNSSPRIEDLNGDGVIDVVVRQQGHEAGLGYESYLTWYRWNGVSYELYRTVNVVRNLTAYLEQTLGLVRDGKWGEFALWALGEETAQRLHEEEGMSSFEIFSAVFTLVDAEAQMRNTPLPEDARIRKIVYPSIHEDPFATEDEEGLSFPLTVRIETSADSFHVYAARVYMARNPFEKPQFRFALHAQSDPTSSSTTRL